MAVTASTATPTEIERAESLIFNKTFKAIGKSKEKKDLYERLDLIFKPHGKSIVDPNLCGIGYERNNRVRLVKIPLLYAVIEQVDDPLLVPTIEYLLNINANPNFCAKDPGRNQAFISSPPLQAAVSRSHLPITKLLIERGAEVNPIISTSMRTPNYVHLAVEQALDSKKPLQNGLQVLQYLLENKAEIEFNNLPPENSLRDDRGESLGELAAIVAIQQYNLNKLAVLRCLLPFTELWRSSKVSLARLAKNRQHGKYETCFGREHKVESLLGVAYRIMRERLEQNTDMFCDTFPKSSYAEQVIKERNQPYIEVYQLVLNSIKSCIIEYANELLLRINNKNSGNQAISIDQFKIELQDMTMRFIGQSQIPDILENELEEHVYQPVLIEFARKYVKEIPEFENIIKEYEKSQAQKEKESAKQGEKYLDIKFFNERLQRIEKITQTITNAKQKAKARLETSGETNTSLTFSPDIYGEKVAGNGLRSMTVRERFT